MRFFLGFILVLVANISPIYACDALIEEGLDPKQQKVLFESFLYGVEHGLSYSLAAIAWQESSGGKWRLNIKGSAFGVHHITINNAIAYSSMDDTTFNRNVIAQKLMDDNDYSASMAVYNLKFWQSRYGKDWAKVWGSYYSGYNIEPEDVYYAKDIADKVGKIASCNWEKVIAKYKRH